MKTNPIQFAVVREDPNIEIDIIRQSRASEILMIASGGCTALTLQSHFPDLKQSLIDPNQAQLDLVQRKMDRLLAGVDEEVWNIGATNPEGLNQCGNFEGLFRSLRHFLAEFVFPSGDPDSLFDQPQLLVDSIESPFWQEAMNLFFSDSLLVRLFGPDAVQHGAAGSYADYFNQVFARGFSRQDIGSNYFLHHIFLGYYRRDALPDYLKNPPKSFHIELQNGFLADVPDLSKFDLIQLSNIFDWMSDEAIDEIAARVSKEAKSGAHILFRQLNNARNFEEKFSGFQFDRQWAQTWQQKDRSLFYNKINLGKKI